MEEHPEFDLCATQIAFMTERGKVAWDKRQPKTAWFKANPTAKCFLKTSARIRRNHAWTTLFRTELLAVTPEYREAFITSEDIDMWLRFLGTCAVSLYSAIASRSTASRAAPPPLCTGGKTTSTGNWPRNFTSFVNGASRTNWRRLGKSSSPLPPKHHCSRIAAPPGRQLSGRPVGVSLFRGHQRAGLGRNYPDHSNGLAGWLATEANLSRDFFPLVAYSSGQNGSMVQRENTGGD